MQVSQNVFDSFVEVSQLLFGSSVQGSQNMFESPAQRIGAMVLYSSSIVISVLFILLVYNIHYVGQLCSLEERVKWYISTRLGFATIQNVSSHLGLSYKTILDYF